MARISYVDVDALEDPELAGYLEDSRRFGTPRPESQSIRAHVPEVLRSFSRTWDGVFRNGVTDHRIKELCRVFVARTLDCGYCAGQRSHVAAADGLTERGYDDLIEFRTSDSYSEREKTALAYAEAIAWDPAMADDGLWERLHQHFSEPEIVELGYFIGVTMGQQRWLKTMQVRHGEVPTGTTAGLAPGLAG
jgi:AhpD family alkylhydroperoxidase